MRPDSIILFERLYLGALALGLVNLFVSWDRSIALMTSDPGAAALGDPATFILVVFVISFGVSLTLWYFAARRRSRVAKWILTVLFVLGLFSLPGSIAQGVFSGIGGLFAAAAWLLQAVALFMLFRPDSNAWFRGEWQGDVAERFE